jgi:membrane protease YdiL (CAAX protease family)
MDNTQRQGSGYTIPSTALIAQLVMTFAISWGVTGVYIAAPQWAASRFGEISGSHPFFFIATWAPAISAFFLVVFFTGLSGLKSFVSRLFFWRIPFGWVVFVLFVIPLVYMAGSVLKGGPLMAPPPPDKGAGALAALLVMMLFLGPIEEFGWRGVAQPILQRHLAPIWAGALIGAIWGVWHLPAFYLAGTVYGSWDFMPFFIGNVTLGILVTPLFNHARGSLLWPMLFHWQLINPFWPDAQPYDTTLFAVVAAFTIWWNRDTMFACEGAVTEIIPGENSHKPT